MNILLYARCHERDLVRGIIHRCLKVFFLWGWEGEAGGGGRGLWRILGNDLARLPGP